MHISYKNRLLWQIKVTYPLVAIIYNRFTYPWRFTRVPSVTMQYRDKIMSHILMAIVILQGHLESNANSSI